MPGDPDETARLFAEIIAQPASDEARLVYADHLIELGDPRGDFIGLQCRAEHHDVDDVEREALVSQARDLLAHHETAWTADLRAIGIDSDMTQLSFQRGYVEHVWLRATELASKLPALRARTPIRHLRLSLPDAGSARAAWPHAVTVERITVMLLGRTEREEIEEVIATWHHEGAIRVLDAGTPSIVTSVTGDPRARGLEELSASGLDAASISRLCSCPHLDTLRRLHAPHARHGREGIVAIAQSPTLANLEALDVSGCDLTATELDALLEAPFASRLTTLRLAQNALGTTGRLGEVGRALEVLDLDGIGLSARAIADVLAAPAFGRLRRLDISRNRFEDGELATALAGMRLPGLRGLVADHCNVAEATTSALAAAPLVELRWLDLHDNPFGDAALIALARTGGLPALWRLQLSRCDIGVTGCAALGASKLGARLRSLDLSRNRIDDDAFAALLAADGLDALESLTLDGNQLTETSIDTLARSALRHRLRRLSLSGVSSATARAVLALELPELRELHVGGVDDAAIEPLARDRMPNLRDLSLRAPALTDDGAEQLARAALPHVLWLELLAPGLSDVGRAELRRAYSHHAMVFDQALLRDFAMLGRTI